MKKVICLIYSIIISIYALADYGDAINEESQGYDGELRTYTKAELEAPWGIGEWIWTIFFIVVFIYIVYSIWQYIKDLWGW